MITVVNKAKIESMMNQFYDTACLKDNHHPLLVNKISVFTESCFSVGDAGDGFIDDDVAYDFNLAMVFDCHNTDTFPIKPSTAFISNEPDIGMAFTWISNKPVYVTSKADYIRLYESFVQYLETTHVTSKVKHDFVYEDMEVKICFVNLYDTVLTEDSTLVDETCVNVMFAEEHFKPESVEVRTLNAIFEFMQF